MTNAIQKAMLTHRSRPGKTGIDERGRPKLDPRETARRTIARETFGQIMRRLREGQSLNLERAAKLCGLKSGRMLAQYELNCFPPGRVVNAMAAAYGVEKKRLAKLVVFYSDPELHLALFGEQGFKPDDDVIEAFLSRTATTAETLEKAA